MMARDAAQPAETTTSARYHWIMTIQFTDGVQGTGSDIVTLTPPVTRQAVYEWILKKTYEQIGTENVSVVFFSLEPDAIPGAGA